jgi:hypothetical protein
VAIKIARRGQTGMAVEVSQSAVIPVSSVQPGFECRHGDQFTPWCLLDSIPYESALGSSEGIYISRGLNHPHITTSFFQTKSGNTCIPTMISSKLPAG